MVLLILSAVFTLVLAGLLEHTYRTIKEDGCNSLIAEVRPGVSLEFFALGTGDDKRVLSKRYKELALVCHPDRVGADQGSVGHHNMVIINQHYDRAKDMLRDVFIESVINNSHGGDGGSWTTTAPKRYKDYPFLERFLFKTKRYIKLTLSLIFIYLVCTKARLRKYFIRFLLVSFVVIFIYLLRGYALITLTLFIICRILLMCCCWCCCSRYKRK
jgi:hypothetical protein